MSVRGWYDVGNYREAFRLGCWSVVGCGKELKSGVASSIGMETAGVLCQSHTAVGSRLPADSTIQARRQQRVASFTAP